MTPPAPLPDLLLLEDDPAIAHTVVYALQREGFAVTHCTLLQQARQQVARRLPAAAVLDVGLPDGSGLDLCRQWRQDSATARLPILILSARADELDRVLGLELGADDYLAKPFSPRELAARVRALLRRSAPPSPANAPAGQTPPPQGFWHDRAGQRIHLHGSALPLTRLEYGLLACLLEAEGRILTRDWLLHRVWGQQADSADRTVDTHIKTLRAKLRAHGATQDYIHTHRGLGYCLQASGPVPAPA